MLGQLLGDSKDYSFVEPVTIVTLINQTMAFISSLLNTLEGTGATKVPQSSRHSHEHGTHCLAFFLVDLKLSKNSG